MESHVPVINKLKLTFIFQNMYSCIAILINIHLLKDYSITINILFFCICFEIVILQN